MSRPSLLAISGSLRAASVNTKLVHEAVRVFGQAEVQWGDLRLPLYDGDLEDAEGIPPAVQRLADQIAAADAVVISTPEYNQSLSGVLKNALDWVSRVDGKPWKDKPVTLLSAAAGRAGGARANYALRLAITPFRPRLLTGELMLAGASKEFDDQGRLTSEVYTRNLTALMAELRAEIGR